MILCTMLSSIQLFHIDGLVQERRNSSVLAMELRLFAQTHLYKALETSMFGVIQDNKSLSSSLSSLLTLSFIDCTLLLTNIILYLSFSVQNLHDSACISLTH